MLNNQIFDNITTEIRDQYEEEFEENKINGDDHDEDSDEEDIMDAVVDREARRVLFDLLHITYHCIRVYKAVQFDEIIDAVAEKFEVLPLSLW